jgi:hypothetical protein
MNSSIHKICDSLKTNINIYPSSNTDKKNNYVNKNNEKSFLLKKKDLKSIKTVSSSVYDTHLGFKNKGLFCWCNSSLKLLITMLYIEDILLLRTVLSNKPDSNINKVRNSFIRVWDIYNSFNGSGINRAFLENKLEIAKNILITHLQKFVQEGGIESGGLREYFMSGNSNKRQDTNLFLMEMEIILCVNNPSHKLKSCTYIEATYTGQYENKKILRKSSENPALIISIAPQNRINSINKYIELISCKEANTYYWSAKELLQEGISTTSSNDTPIKGNKFEAIEADLDNLNNFIIYFSLPDIDDKFSLKQSHKKITEIILSDDFPNDSINMCNLNNIKKQYKVLVTAKAIICFTGVGASTHYVCLTIESNKKVVLHDDNRINLLCYSNNLNKPLRNFFDKYNFTPYSILYEVKK